MAVRHLGACARIDPSVNACRCGGWGPVNPLQHCMAACGGCGCLQVSCYASRSIVSSINTIAATSEYRMHIVVAQGGGVLPTRASLP